MFGSGPPRARDRLSGAKARALTGPRSLRNRGRLSPSAGCRSADAAVGASRRDRRPIRRACEGDGPGLRIAAGRPHSRRLRTGTEVEEADQADRDHSDQNRHLAARPRDLGTFHSGSHRAEGVVLRVGAGSVGSRRMVTLPFSGPIAADTVACVGRGAIVRAPPRPWYVSLRRTAGCRSRPGCSTSRQPARGGGPVGWGN